MNAPLFPTPQASEGAAIEVWLSVSHLSRRNQIWRAEGAGIVVTHQDPETHWALAALEAGLDPLLPVHSFVNGRPSLRYPSLEACAAEALRASRETRSIERRLVGVEGRPADTLETV